MLRLTESTEEGQGQDQPSSFRSLVLERAIPHTLAQYVTALFTLPDGTQVASQDSARHESRTLPVEETSTTDSAVARPADTERKPPLDGSATASTLEPPNPTSAAATATQTESDSGGHSNVSQAGSSEQQTGSGERQPAGKELALCGKGSEQWAKGIGMAGLPWALKLLAAFARGHQVMYLYALNLLYPMYPLYLYKGWTIFFGVIELLSKFTCVQLHAWEEPTVS